MQTNKPPSLVSKKQHKHKTQNSLFTKETHDTRKNKQKLTHEMEKNDFVTSILQKKHRFVCETRVFFHILKAKKETKTNKNKWKTCQKQTNSKIKT